MPALKTLLDDLMETIVIGNRVLERQLLKALQIRSLPPDLHEWVNGIWRVGADDVLRHDDNYDLRDRYDCHYYFVLIDRPGKCVPRWALFTTQDGGIHAFHERHDAISWLRNWQNAESRDLDVPGED